MKLNVAALATLIVPATFSVVVDPAVTDPPLTLNPPTATVPFGIASASVLFGLVPLLSVPAPEITPVSVSMLLPDTSIVLPAVFTVIGRAVVNDAVLSSVPVLRV